MDNMDPVEQFLVGMVVLFQILALCLKLTGHLPGMPWWWVFSPIWIPAFVVTGLIVLMLSVASVIYYIKSRD